MTLRPELSKKRIQEARNEAVEHFDKWAHFRHVFNVIPIGDTQIKNTDDFLTIGFNHIIKRKWFLDNGGTTYYDHLSLGMVRGKGVALGETRHILNRINEEISKLELELLVQKDDLIRSISRRIRNKGSSDLAILVNPMFYSTLLKEKGFKMGDRHVKGIWGYYQDVPVIWFSQVEKDSVYLVNRNAGRIIVNEDLVFRVSDLKTSEYDKILSNIDTLTRSDLSVSVRVTSYVSIKLILSPSPPLVLLKIVARAGD